MALGTLGIIAIILLIIALIMLIVGIILLIVNTTNTTDWWVWFLILGGVILGITAGIMLAIDLAEPTVVISPCARPMYPSCPQPVPYVQPVATRCPYAAQPPVVAPVAPVYQPVYQPPPVPRPTYSERTERIGQEMFDPDPVESTIVTPGESVRRVIVGPYGEAGQNIEISGVHTLPSVKRTITRDIPPHAVQSDLSNF